MFYTKGVLRNFTKLTGKHLCQSLFFNKVTLAQMFSCEFCKISKNTFLHRIVLVAASAQGKKNGETTESNENFDCYTIKKFKSKYINIKTIHPIFLTFFFIFPFSRFSYFHLFCVWLSFKSRHLELFCKTAVWQNITKIVLFFYVKLELFSVQFIKYE